MNEHLLRFIWQHLYFNRDELSTIQQEPVQIISQGLLNTNQGPDFLHAKLLINNVTWAGTIELHLKTSDWQKHGHTNDEHYNNVILHVVYEHDETGNATIPILELKNHISTSLLQHYRQLMEQTNFVACENQLQQVNEIVWDSWKERMVA
jgi:hypothetical protein